MRTRSIFTIAIATAAIAVGSLAATGKAPAKVGGWHGHHYGHSRTWHGEHLWSRGLYDPCDFAATGYLIKLCPVY